MMAIKAIVPMGWLAALAVALPANGCLRPPPQEPVPGPT